MQVTWDCWWLYTCYIVHPKTRIPLWGWHQESSFIVIASNLILMLEPSGTRIWVRVCSNTKAVVRWGRTPTWNRPTGQRRQVLLMAVTGRQGALTWTQTQRNTWKQCQKKFLMHCNSKLYHTWKDAPLLDRALLVIRWWSRMMVTEPITGIVFVLVNNKSIFN